MSFQRQRVRSSRTCYRPFNLAMGRSPGFASAPCDLNARLRLAFATPTWGYHLSLPQRTTRRLIMQKARRHPPEGGLRPLVRVWFQVLLTSLAGSFSPFSRPTGQLSVVQEYLALEGGPSSFTPSFTGSTLLWCTQPTTPTRLRGCHPLRHAFPDASTSLGGQNRCPQPRAEARFGLSRFRSPLLTGSRFLSFPAVTEMFQFSAFAPDTYAFSAGYPHQAGGFPHSDISGSTLGCQLP